MPAPMIATSYCFPANFYSESPVVAVRAVSGAMKRHPAALETAHLKYESSIPTSDRRNSRGMPALNWTRVQFPTVSVFHAKIGVGQAWN